MHEDDKKPFFTPMRVCYVACFFVVVAVGVGFYFGVVVPATAPPEYRFRGFDWGCDVVAPTNLIDMMNLSMQPILRNIVEVGGSGTYDCLCEFYSSFFDVQETLSCSTLVCTTSTDITIHVNDSIPVESTSWAAFLPNEFKFIFSSNTTTTLLLSISPNRDELKKYQSSMLKSQFGNMYLPDKRPNEKHNCHDGAVCTVTSFKNTMGVLPYQNRWSCSSGWDVDESAPYPLGIGTECRCSQMSLSMADGRPFLDNLVPPVVRTDSSELRNKHSNDWLRSAQFELASVASFSKFSIELIVHGAPAYLIEKSHKAALQEIKHSKLCLAAAAYLEKKPDDNFKLGRLPTSVVMFNHNLTRLAVDTALDGAIAEATAAVAAAVRISVWDDLAMKGFVTMTSPVSRALTAIMMEEASHAALAWSALSWIVSVGDGDGDGQVLRSVINNCFSCFGVLDFSELDYLFSPSSAHLAGQLLQRENDFISLFVKSRFLFPLSRFVLSQNLTEVSIKEVVQGLPSGVISRVEFTLRKILSEIQ